MSDELVMVDVVEILHTVRGSVDFGAVDSGYYPGETMDEMRTSFWKQVIQQKASDTGFGYLVDSMLRKGFDLASPIGWNNERITEGHHRLVAAILLGLDTVPTTPFGGGTGRNHTLPPGRMHFSAHFCHDAHPVHIDW